LALFLKVYAREESKIEIRVSIEILMSFVLLVIFLKNTFHDKRY